MNTLSNTIADLQAQGRMSNLAIGRALGLSRAQMELEGLVARMYEREAPPSPPGTMEDPEVVLRLLVLVTGTQAGDICGVETRYVPHRRVLVVLLRDHCRQMSWERIAGMFGRKHKESLRRLYERAVGNLDERECGWLLAVQERLAG